ncbi:response regulator [Rhizobium redzepovicii]|uniref:Response regulator n=1 Tax=Rhizobium redzepovicii TaxID=2867518 RepID=A0AAW8PDH1_9HYPH|nr:response regulator [Rhizobium redzepovicii]MDR9764235.1 response regulator [Rhizobium redzepovicii]
MVFTHAQQLLPPDDPFNPADGATFATSNSSAAKGGQIIMQNSLSLAGRFYLVVEDEYLAASSMMTALEDEGAEVAGPVSNVAGALELVRKRAYDLDGAILDINLRGVMAYPVAEKLAEYGIPFVFVTGYECGSMPEPFKAMPCLNKPCNEKELLVVLAGLPARQKRPGVHPLT